MRNLQFSVSGKRPIERHTDMELVIDHHCIGLLQDKLNCRLRISRECRERFPRYRVQRKPLVSKPVMQYGTCVTHVIHVGIVNLRLWAKPLSAFPAHVQPPILYIWHKAYWMSNSSIPNQCLHYFAFKNTYIKSHSIKSVLISIKKCNHRLCLYFQWKYRHNRWLHF